MKLASVNKFFVLRRRWFRRRIVLSMMIAMHGFGVVATTA